MNEATGEQLIKKGATFTAENLRTLPYELYERITVQDGEDLEEGLPRDPHHPEP